MKHYLPAWKDKKEICELFDYSVKPKLNQL